MYVYARCCKNTWHNYIWTVLPRCLFALARFGTYIIVAFFGLDALVFRVLGLFLHISARYPSMIASCLLFGHRFTATLYCVLSLMSLATMPLLGFTHPHSVLLFRDVI
jgi:hypothetical protein